MKNLYNILGVSQNSSKSEIIAEFRKQAKLNHPDISNKSNANEIIQDIYEAREILSDDIQRKEYDLLFNGKKEDQSYYDSIFEESIKTSSFDASKFIRRSFSFISLLFIYPFKLYNFLATIFVGGFISLMMIGVGFSQLPESIFLTIIGVILGKGCIKSANELAIDLKNRFINDFMPE